VNTEKHWGSGLIGPRRETKKKILGNGVRRGLRGLGQDTGKNGFGTQTMKGSKKRRAWGGKGGGIRRKRQGRDGVSGDIGPQ